MSAMSIPRSHSTTTAAKTIPRHPRKLLFIIYLRSRVNLCAYHVVMRSFRNSMSHTVAIKAMNRNDDSIRTTIHTRSASPSESSRDKTRILSQMESPHGIRFVPGIVFPDLRQGSFREILDFLYVFYGN